LEYFLTELQIFKIYLTFFNLFWYCNCCDPDNKLNHKITPQTIMRKNTFYAVLAIAILTITSCTKDKLVIDTPVLDYVQIPDAKFEQELINLGIDSDGIVNQKVLRSEAQSVERLNIYNSDIDDLTGIEAFINLKRLHAQGNSLVTVDLSKNVLLDTIKLFSNLLIEVKGLSAATNLKYLSLSYNYLTEFTIENPSLVSLLIETNDLTSLDATLAVNLEGLLVFSNKLETADFSNNLKLTVLRIADNKLTNLTLGQKEDLSYLSCSDNLLTDLDLSNFDNLVTLYAHSNPGLTCIKIKSGQNILTQELSAYQELNTDCN